jgi:Secretion system C-terminal sorting domain
MKHIRITILLLLTLCFSFGFNKNDGNKTTSQILTNDHYNYISVNEIKMYISNNGDGSHDPNTDGQGLYWPGGINATQGAVFEDGLVWGGIINNDTSCGGSTYRHGLQAGKILDNGTADDPTLEKYRVYKVLNGWENLPPGPERDQYEQDYNEWPADEGAPFNDVNSDGIYTPGIDNPYIGNETMWCVSNDLDASKTMYLYGSMPMGLEVQTLAYAFNQTGFLGNTILKKYTLINKSQNTIDNMYLAYWADDDLGDGNDDFVGCDTVLNLGYTYNGDNNDQIYGTTPPAIGHMFVQGPIIPGNLNDSAYFKNHWKEGYKNLPITSFTFYINGAQIYSDPVFGSPHQIYNCLQGLSAGGDDIIDPTSGNPTRYTLSGDPVAGTGWYEGAGWPSGPAPSDIRSMITTGPFTMAPGDTQEVVVTIFLAQGIDNIQSVAALKDRALEIQNYYGAYTITGIEQNPANAIKGFRLMQNYPNPFNPTTSIQYAIGSRQYVSLKIYDVLGNEVATLVNEEKTAGNYSIKFDASKLASGIYFYKLSSGSFVQTCKMIFLK